MDNSQVKIFHLYHSGVAIKTPNHFLIFDYYLDKVADNKERTLENGIITAEFLKNEKNVIVFVTHNHGDHLNPVIFHWQEVNPNITYVLGDDCFVPSHLQNFYEMRAYDGIEFNNHINIKTYGTTDRGVSFYVEVDGFKIFHAGDLNWWHWKHFSLEARKKEEEDFKAEVNRISETIDIAFVPVDPRLEEYYHLAGEYFIQKIHPKLLVPIHFADEYIITEEFANKLKNQSVAIAVIKDQGQMIDFSKVTT